MNGQQEIFVPNTGAAVPLGMTQAYCEALEAQDGTCAHVSKPRRSQDPGTPCTRSVNGGHRLYLFGLKLYCQQHFDKLRLDRKKGLL